MVLKITFILKLEINQVAELIALRIPILFKLTSSIHPAVTFLRD
jgi:hypothetical protein